MINPNKICYVMEHINGSYKILRYVETKGEATHENLEFGEAVLLCETLNNFVHKEINHV